MSNVAQQLDRMITGYWISQSIYAAAALGIADHLTKGPRHVDQLAQATSCNPDALFRLLRALASVGVFEETLSRQFQLTPLADLLRSDVEGSKRSLALMLGDEQYHAWSEIVYSVQSGATAFEKVFGQPIFEYLRDHPAKGQIFDEAMTGIHGRETGALLDAYDFSGVRVLADIGGGNGSNLVAVLQSHPQISGILFDLPQVVERAKSRIDAAGLADRCQRVGGNFFESIPTGPDTMVLRHIIHDWDDEKSLQILGNCWRAMPAGGRLLIVESVIPPGNEPFGGKFLDLVMLLIPGGKERTAEEYRSLLQEAGFEMARIIPTSTELSIIEGIRR